jgi:hypothetical protein
MSLRLTLLSATGFVCTMFLLVFLWNLTAYPHQDALFWRVALCSVIVCCTATLSIVSLYFLLHRKEDA